MGGNPPALKLPPSPRLRGDKMGDKTGDKQARGGGQRRRRGEWLMDVGLWSGHQPSSTNHEPIRVAATGSGAIFRDIGVTRLSADGRS